MAGEESRVVSAYVEIKARKATGFNEDARRMGQEAGREYEKGFGGQVEGSASKNAATGRRVGGEIGDAAGTESGRRTSRGLTDTLVRARSQQERAGEKIGATLGDSIGKTAGRRAAALTRRQLTAELAEQSKLLGRAQSEALREDKARDRAADKAAAAYARRFANIRRDASRTGDFIGKALSRGLLSVGAVGAGASSLSGLGGLLAGTVGAVTQLSGAVGVLPGAFAAAGIGAGVLKLGLTGIGDALKNNGDPKKYAEALKQLSPAARGFVKAIVGLKPELKEIKSQVQQGIFKGAGKEVDALGKRYLPLVKTGLGAVAKEFGRGRGQVARYFDSISSSSKVKGILDDTTKSSAHLSDALKPAASALLNITSTGAKLLPGLTGRLEEAAHSFEKFTTRTRNNGSMKEFFEGGLSAAKDFARVVGNAGRILGGIFKAGGGQNGGALGTLAALLGQVADQIGRPEFQQGLGNFFGSFKSAGESVGDALPKVADALVKLEPALSKIVSGSGVALGSILGAAADAAIKLAPVLEAVATGFQHVAPHAGAVVGTLLGIKAAIGAVRFVLFLNGLRQSAALLLQVARATRLWAAAQAVLDAVLVANPIGLVVVGLALLATGLVIAYKKSETFRTGVQVAFRVAATAVLGAVSKILGVMGSLFGVLGHLPGKAGSSFRSAATAARQAKEKVDGLVTSLNKVKSKRITLSVGTIFYQKGKAPGSYGNGLGVLAPAYGGQVRREGYLRRATGGYVNPRLGGPRQDNVPLLVSGGEFVVNAYATQKAGVLALLRKINSTNQLPQALADGGTVRRASAGLDDLSTAKATRREVLSGPPGGTAAQRLHADDIAAITAGFAAAIRQQKVVLDSGAIAGAVYSEGGRVWG